MNKILLFFFLTIAAISPNFAQSFTVSGKVVNSKNNKPAELVTIMLSGSELWAVSDANGSFILRNVPAGETVLSTHSLGFVKSLTKIDVKNDIANLVISIEEDNLALDEVVVTAQRKSADLATSYVLDRTTMDHAQILNVADLSSLLPGGKTPKNIRLTDDNRFALRGNSSEKGNATFGTAIEIDGVRLDNNALLEDGLKGVSTRGVSSVNIESVEMVTGIASVEYGDLSNGIVKVKTKKGKTPYNVEFSTKPNTKQFALSKGFLLGEKAGVLNADVEHAKSNNDIASPYTTYERNSVALKYSNSFNQNRRMPINLTVGLAGNIGAYNDKDDPDRFLNEYEMIKDNTIRGNFKLDFLMNKSWITNLELSGSFSYSDKIKKENDKKDSSTEQAALHGKEEGHFLSVNYNDNPNAPITLIPKGEWYELKYTDNKPVYYTLKAKADWARKFGQLTNKVMIGAEYTRSGNRGKGIYYDNMMYAPSWREDKYKDYPDMNNTALYIEDRFTLPVTKESNLQVMAGLRSDITSIDRSEYGTVASLSPRVNAKYVFWEKNNDKLVRSLNIYGGWGKAVKLPSFQVLYPKAEYSDVLTFTTNGASGEKLYGYYTMPVKPIYNPNLKWQYTKQTEIGIEANILGAKVMLSTFFSTTVNPYMRSNFYQPISYTYTKGTDLTTSLIPTGDRIFTMNRETGTVTVSDKNGILDSQILSSEKMESYKSTPTYVNGSDIKRSGLEWIVEFPQIKAIRTTVRIDGNFYRYKGLDETLVAESNNTMMANNKPYAYVGYYPGSFATSVASTSIGPSNGSLSREVNSNLTFTTHIPKIRLIISMKIEGSFYSYKQSLNDYKGTRTAFVLQDIDGFDTSNRNIYNGDNIIAIHPLYYSTWENPNEKIPFTEKFIWAKENDPALYTELAKLVKKTSSSTYFNADRISSYFTANLSVTKELGDFATISFLANNFLNTMKQIKDSKEGNVHTSLYNNAMVPRFYYGLTLRLKL